MFGFDNAPIVSKASIVIARPAEEVFRFIGVDFFKNYCRWSPEVQELKQLSPGSVGVGTKARQVRVDQGHRTESIFGVTVFQPHSRVCFEGISNPYKCDYELKGNETDGSTRVTFIFELPKLEMYMRPFEKLIRVVMQDGSERTVRNLKRLIEAESTACVE
ncbi:SRPBCC family protein [Methylotetracoccus oryzae]|uniref:SRPBCC family protein n=1 Tax=Methylotetracoccus oryzae TaxID=1919059 RepID=UPI00111ADA16|nr:SRPBCC family protein [Methylotetracoccus oryzae]